LVPFEKQAVEPVAQPAPIEQYTLRRLNYYSASAEYVIKIKINKKIEDVIDEYVGSINTNNKELCKELLLNIYYGRDNSKFHMCKYNTNNIFELPDFDKVISLIEFEY
jgi:hypothetical protein